MEILLIIVALPVYFYYQSTVGWESFCAELRAAWWMLLYRKREFPPT
ncbi:MULTISPECIES: hypothetical protein [Paraburkholderia]